jgi:SAM-dependent methyltransferase
MKNTEYSEDFYKDQMDESRKSAKEIIPLLLKKYKPKSVIDIGCGSGSWLAEFYAQGIKDICGIDGEYVKEALLQIPNQCFKPFDIRNLKYEDINRRYDLATSVEVAEHLDKEKASQFVELLTKLSDVILFSSAVPYQGGTEHKNENWMQYWICMFKEFGFVPFDLFRNKIWNNPNVCFWYKQNILLFIKEDKVKNVMGKKSPKKIIINQYIHPEMFVWACVRNFDNKNELFSRDKAYLNKINKMHMEHKKINNDQVIAYNNTYSVKFSNENLLTKIKTRIKKLF